MTRGERGAWEHEGDVGQRSGCKEMESPGFWGLLSEKLRVERRGWMGGTEGLPGASAGVWCGDGAAELRAWTEVCRG